MPLADDPRRLALARYPWRLGYQTRFGDMDINRHVNNVAIARIYEEGRVRFSLDWRARHPGIEGARFLVAHTTIDYLVQGRYPAPVDVGVAVIQLGRTSYRFGQGLFQGEDCIGLADTVLVFQGEAGSAPIPNTLRAVLAGYPLS